MMPVVVSPQVSTRSRGVGKFIKSAIVRNHPIFSQSSSIVCTWTSYSQEYHSVVFLRGELAPGPKCSGTPCGRQDNSQTLHRIPRAIAFCYLSAYTVCC